MRSLCPLLVAALVAPSIASAQDKTKAAEYFALAQSAERRNDWQAAIHNYELAYKAAPHPNVLYNIGLNYERLGKLRTSAEYLLRYVDKSPSAPDRDRVLLKVRKLRERPASIEFNSKPSGAEIFVDGEMIGTAPVSRELSGSHDVYAEIEGERSRTRRIKIEYAEAFSVQLTIGAKPGRLTIRASVDGAQIRIDGSLVGTAPYSEMVDAGEHRVEVIAPGYETAVRTVMVPAQGSEQIRAEMTPLPGTKTAPPKVGAKLLLGASFGLNVGTDEAGQANGRGLFQVGYRARGAGLDLLANLGTFGFGTGGIGGEARMYVFGKKLRWYVRGGLSVGFGEDDNGSVPVGFEGGLGVNLGAANPKGRYEFFAETNLQIARVGTEPVAMPGTGMLQRRPAGLLTPLATVRLNFPLTLGFAVRFGK